MWCENRPSLGVAVSLPREHGELVLLESKVVQPLAGKVVVDNPVGRFGRSSEWPLGLDEHGVVFREGPEMLGAVIPRKAVVSGRETV